MTGWRKGLAQLRRLEKKYSTDEEGLAALLADSERRLDELEYAGDRLAQLEKETAKAYALAEKKARALTDIRQAAGKAARGARRRRAS